ncbi:MAG: DEAD/DEAH box helicase [Sulfuricurvum sp.]|uniref:DEAD/DEAH box helicase n=1 Tax=Sulfuricurvum sp. TaxID=2025608 RepID=UPI00261128CB|nr:DEAD/DEAH box helicase [Sulfuricurvum sp.]MDD2368718.1 DEAD/DEAH box helicase [Sulfuricurvum sp.]MDD5117883.1 DEAD/DEAH box helicase [Sulfuricurvum sp.]
MSFTTLGLSPHLLDTLTAKGYSEPTPIQTQVIPLVLRGRDILGAAQTGTGKTAAFALPIIHKLISAADAKQASARALVIVPTRELASQVAEAIRSYAEGLELTVIALYGGANMARQAKELEEGVDIIVATPGRLIELNKQGHVPLSRIEYLVFDEADTIFDMGFIREVGQIIDLLPLKRQNMLFSATMTPAVKQLSEKILNKPLLVEIDNLKAADMTLRQVVHPVEKERKKELLSYLIGSNNYPQVLVFTRTKAEADEVSADLTASGLKNVVIHGDKKHGARDRALNEFREGNARILVATDIAARGLDIEGLDVVINYDIPHVSTDYLHRIGRTGRAGNDGLAITLLSSSEHISWSKIITMLGKNVETILVPGFEPPADNALVKTRGKSLSKEAEKKGKTEGAFGNKRKKEPVQPKFVGKRGPRLARDEPSGKSNSGRDSAFGNSKKPSPKKSGGRGR